MLSPPCTLFQFSLTSYSIPLFGISPSLNTSSFNSSLSLFPFCISPSNLSFFSQFSSPSISILHTIPSLSLTFPLLISCPNWNCYCLSGEFKCLFVHPLQLARKVLINNCHLFLLSVCIEIYSLLYDQ